MRAVICETFGKPPVVADVAKPRAGRGQILVRQHRSSVNGGDVHLAEGRPYVLRPVFAAMLRPPVLGRDVAGVVEAVGPGVQAFDVGDRVIGEASGAWAEHVVVREQHAAQVPDGVTLEQAATLPVSALTALQGLRDPGQLRAGAQVLIVGASGCVGSMAVQVARAMGAVVTGVCSAAKADAVLGMGATRVIDYRQARFTEARGAYDLIFDLAGTEPVGACLASLTERGVYVSSAGSCGSALFGPLPRMAHVAARGWFDRRLRVHAETPNSADLAAVLNMVQREQLRPWIGEEIGLDGVADSLRRMACGELHGTSVIRMPVT